MKKIYKDCILSMRETKLMYNQMKLDTIGYIDNDDHGMIPLSHKEGFPPLESSPDGKAYGPADIGKCWKLWLSEYHPTYINPNSALAGAWFGTVPGLGKWRPEDRPVHLRPLHELYNYVQTGIGGMNHMCPDMRIGLDTGFPGLLEKVRRFRYLNNPVDTGFYDGEEDFLLGMMKFIERHAEAAREMERSETDEFKKNNLEIMAQVNENLLQGPPKTLREAVQLLCWFQTFSRMYFTSGALGQIDELLRPYYEQDIKNGNITDDEVVWFIASLLINDTHYSQIGGPHPADGHDISSRMSYLVLEATHQLRIPCHIALRLHDNYNHDLFHRAVTYLFEDGTGVNYSCSGGLDKGYMKNSAPLGLARLRAKVGCNWTALPGIEYCLQDVSRVCLVKPLLLALDDMMRARGIIIEEIDWREDRASKDPASNGKAERKKAADKRAVEEMDKDRLDRLNAELEEKIFTGGVRFEGDYSNIPMTMEELWERYCGHLEISVKIMKYGMDWHMSHHGRNTPEMVINLFCHGPIERGLDAVDGGVDIYNLNADGVGLATVADSFGAIEQRVVNEKRISWEKLYEALKNNYQNDESTRLMMKNIARFGNGGTLSDRWAEKISDKYTRMMKDTPTDDGYEMIPGLFSHGIIGSLGRNLGATPNGRFAGEAISHSADPDPGFMKDGGSAPTAKANAVARVQPGYGNSAPLQIDFDTDLAMSIGGIEAIENLLLTHNKEGGTLININVISKEKILEAHKDPSKYPDLVVRVTGFSAFFASLSPRYRQQIVDRLLKC